MSDVMKFVLAVKFNMTGCEIKGKHDLYVKTKTCLDLLM